MSPPSSAPACPTRSCSRPTPTTSSSASPPPRRAPIRGRLRVLTSDGEFHSARRQFARWAEDGWLELETRRRRAVRRFHRALSRRARASGDHDLILVSQVLFGSGRLLRRRRRARRARPARRPVGGDRRLSRLHGARDGRSRAAAAQSAFYLGGGYKYAMAGEGCAFMHCPPGFGPRPPVTGWFAEFDDLTPAARAGRLCHATRCASWARPSIPSALYRFNAVRRMLADERADDRAHLAPMSQRLQRAAARGDRRHRARRGRTAQPARRRARTRASSPSARPTPQRWYDELTAQQLHHRRPRRRAPHRARPLS